MMRVEDRLANLIGLLHDKSEEDRKVVNDYRKSRDLMREAVAFTGATSPLGAADPLPLPFSPDIAYATWEEADALPGTGLGLTFEDEPPNRVVAVHSPLLATVVSVRKDPHDAMDPKRQRWAVELELFDSRHLHIGMLTDLSDKVDQFRRDTEDPGRVLLSPGEYIGDSRNASPSWLRLSVREKGEEEWKFPNFIGLDLPEEKREEKDFAGESSRG